MIRRTVIALCLAASGALASDVGIWDAGIGQTDQVTSGLVAYWAMRDGGGNAVFEEIGGYTMTNGASSATQLSSYAAGAVGNGIALNGTSEYAIRVTPDFSATSAGSISAWINPTATNAAGALAIFTSADTATNNYYFRFNLYSGAIYIAQTGNGIDNVYADSIRVLAGSWAHVVVTSSGTAYRVFINGMESSVVVQQGSNSGDWLADTLNRDNVVIGGLVLTSSGGYFPGKIDEVRLYNRALTPDEIKQLYRMGATPRRLK